jgi:hypothetical protein
MHSAVAHNTSRSLCQSILVSPVVEPHLERVARLSSMLFRFIGVFDLTALTAPIPKTTIPWNLPLHNAAGDATLSLHLRVRQPPRRRPPLSHCSLALVMFASTTKQFWPIFLRAYNVFLFASYGSHLGIIIFCFCIFVGERDHDVCELVSYLKT